MDSTTILFCLWSASAASGAFLFLVVKPKLRAFEENGRKERERLWECIDRLVSAKTSLQRVAQFVASEQKALAELQGAATLRSLERTSSEFQNAALALVTLEVDAGVLEAELALVVKRHGRFFYHCFLRSTAITAKRMIETAQQVKAQILDCSSGTASRQALT